MVDSDSDSDKKEELNEKLTAEESEQLLDVESKRSPVLLRLTAEMFRQHSDLFLQHAAVLERVATHPNDPSSWKIEEEPPESVQKTLLRENVTALAIKSYESMLLVQKRVDYLETVMRRNGLRPLRRAVKEVPKKVLLPATAKNAFYWFRHEHGPRFAEEAGVKDIYSHQVKNKLAAIWETMSPSQRLPYMKKAKAAVPNFFPKRRPSKAAASRSAKKPDNESEESGDEGPPKKRIATKKRARAAPKSAEKPDGDSDDDSESADLQRKKRAPRNVASVVVNQQGSDWEIEDVEPEEDDSDDLDQVPIVVEL
jgi:hypothetical protein